jgi:hypothetical protein
MNLTIYVSNDGAHAYQTSARGWVTRSVELM